MELKLLTSLLLLFLVSGKVFSQHEKEVVVRRDIKGKFKYSNLTAFNVDSVDLDEPDKDGTRFFNRYFSSQQNRRGLDEFTIYSPLMNEIISVKRILYLVFNVNGRLLSQFTVSENSGESDEYGLVKSNGKFVNDSTYELYSECHVTSEDMNETTYSVTHSIIKRNGGIDQQQLSSKTVKTIVEHIAKDGHRVKSNNAVLVDNWLYEHDVIHSCESIIPELKVEADFYLKDSECFMEVWGGGNMSNDYLVDKRIKFEYFYNKKGIKYMEVYFNEMENIDETMQQKFAQLGIDLKRH